MTSTICGVDVSSEHLDARVGRAGPEARFARTAEGVEALAASCEAHGVGLVAMEATGGHERLPFALPWARGIPAAIVDPRQVRRFAEAMGLPEKTDRLDAGAIAWHAEAERLVARLPAGPTRQKLAAAAARLRQLTAPRVAQANQRYLADDPGVLASIGAVTAVLAARIRAFEARVAELIASDPLCAALDAAFRQVKGTVGRTVARLLAEMPEIGTLPGKAAAKLAGLAPIARDSGEAGGRRPVRGGRAGVRSPLFVVAGVVRRHEPDLTAFHERLAGAGKPAMVVRTALAHKLLARPNAKARDARRELADAAAAAA